MALLKPILPLYTKQDDLEHRGEIPLAFEYHENVALGALVTGIVTKTVTSNFGKGLGDVLGVIPLSTKGAGDNEILAFSASVSSTDNSVDVLVHSSDATATDNNTVSFFLFGRQIPKDFS